MPSIRRFWRLFGAIDAPLAVDNLKVIFVEIRVEFIGLTLDNKQ